MISKRIISLDGYSLSLKDSRDLLKNQAQVEIASELNNETYFQKSIDVLNENLQNGRAIYGVNTLFGGLANEQADCPHDLQKHLVVSHMSSVGEPLPADVVRLTMYLRANSMCHGVSGVRKELVERYIHLANLGYAPVVGSIGSIGASGDLIPLAEIASAVAGMSSRSQISKDSETFAATDVLKSLKLDSITLGPKEGLALINGTSCLTAIAAKNILNLCDLFSLHLAISMAVCETLEIDLRPFQPLIHKHRPHPGQIWVANLFEMHLKHSKLIRTPNCVERDFEKNELVQDRYSTRCIPQFLGAILEDISSCFKTIEIEMNSATDNPLIDTDASGFLHGGNFLGQHVALMMDKLRTSIALLVKHNEAHIAQLVEPAFSRGLPASLTAPGEQGSCVGVKPLQILCNSIAPLLEQKASPLSVHFPVHAEQFNQNINSQGFGSAVLTAESIALMRKHSAATLLIVLQAAQCRAEKNGSDVSDLYTEQSSQLFRWCSSIMGRKDPDAYVCSPDSHGDYGRWVDKISQYLDEHWLPEDMQLFNENQSF